MFTFSAGVPAFAPSQAAFPALGREGGCCLGGGAPARGGRWFASVLAPNRNMQLDKLQRKRKKKCKKDTTLTWKYYCHFPRVSFTSPNTFWLSEFLKGRQTKQPSTCSPRKSFLLWGELGAGPSPLPTRPRHEFAPRCPGIPPPGC